MSIDKFNKEGYYDPTAHEALTNVMREEKTARLYRPIVYICSPLRGNTEANERAARDYCRYAVEQGYIPIAPHLLFPQFLDDSDPQERKLGVRFGEILMDRCAEVWVFGSRISEGMRAEIDRAKRKGYTLRYFTTDCREVTECR